MLYKAGRSLQREIDGFFEALGYDGEKLPLTKGAISKARSALNPLVFKWLNKDSVKTFYQQAKIIRWKGFIVKAIDGSTSILPETHENVRKAFPAHGFGPKAAVQRCIARLSQLYDVFNGVVCDSQMAPYATGEVTLAKEHIKTCSKGDLILFDRGYPGFALFIALLTNKVDFCVRMTSWWNEVKDLLASNEKDRIVRFKLPKEYQEYGDEIILRLIKMKDKDGTVRVFCTSLLDQKQYSKRAINNLYKLRWGVEENYKTLKCRLNLDEFSGITVEAVRQDYYAKMFLITLCRILSFEVKPSHKPRKTKKKDNKPPRPIKINYTYAMSKMKNFLVLLLDQSDIPQLIEKFVKRISKVYEATREGDTNPRIVRENVCRMNYKDI